MTVVLATMPWMPGRADARADDSGAPSVEEARVFAVDEMSLFPPADGNTIHLRQPIAADLLGIEAALVADSVRLIVEDLSTAIVQTPALSVTESVTGLSVVSEAVQLQPGSRYRATIEVADEFGATSSVEWMFRHIDFEVSPATAVMDGSEGRHLGDGVWSFLPAIDVGPFAVTSDASEHSGFGPVGQIVPLAGARVEYTLGGLVGSQVADIYESDASVTVYKQYHKARGEVAATAQMYGQTVRVAPIEVTLPPGASDPVLVMEGVETTPYVPAEDCAVPNLAMPDCTTDPLRFFTPEDFAAELLSFQQQQAGNAVLGEAPVFITERIALEDYNSFYRDYDNILNHWDLVTLDNGVVSTGFEEDAIDLVDDVVYEGNVLPPVPLQFSEACGVGYPCTSTAAQNSSTEEMRKRCISINGEDNWRTDKDCRQFNVLQDIATAKPVWGSNPPAYDFTFVIRSQLGYLDNYRHGPEEQVGVAWDDGGGWQIRTDDYSSWHMAGYDVYYCDGREDGASFEDQQHLYFYQQASSWTGTGYQDTVVSISPYGVASPGQHQWWYSGDYKYSDYADAGFVSDADDECRNFYTDDAHVWPSSRPAYSRMVVMLVSTDAVTHRSQFEGTAVGSAAHVWRSYSFDWSIGPGFGCGFTGCGASFGISWTIDPYERKRSVIVAYPRNYSHGF